MNGRLIIVLLTVVAAGSVAAAVYLTTRSTLSVKEEYSDLTLTTEIPKADLRTTEALTITLTLKCSSKTNLNLGFPTSQRFNILVFDEGGRQVYNWSAHQTFKREFAVYQVLMRPEEKITETIMWNLKDDSGKPVNLGRYYLIAETPFFIYGYIPGLVQGSGTTHIVHSNQEIVITTGKLSFSVNQ